LRSLRTSIENLGRVVSIRLNDLILKSASNYLELQRKDGSFSSGHNGPWNNDDTPVRNTAHIALMLFKAYKISKNEKYLLSAKKACDFLMSNKSRPGGFNFLCRADGDKVNGLIGVSWALEPLIFIGKEMGIKPYLEFSKKLIEMHKYDSRKNLWRIKRVDGLDGSICMTLNQQIWFGTMALTLGNALRDKFLISTSTSFFVNLPNKIRYLEKGIISHVISGGIKQRFVGGFEGLKGNRGCIYERSVGYMPFLAYGLALAYINNKSFKFWKSHEMMKIIKSILLALNKTYSPAYFPIKNKFLGQYNPLGFEIAFVLQTFNSLVGIDQSKIKKWVEFQVKNYFDFDSGFMKKNTVDPLILSARFYETIYLKNYALDIS
jgi:hypothetical protein